MDHTISAEKDEKRRKITSGKRKEQRHGGTSIYPRIIRNHFTDHEGIQFEHNNEASQHHQEFTSKTKGQSRTTKYVRSGVLHNV